MEHYGDTKMKISTLTFLFESAPQLFGGALSTLNTWICAACISIAMGSLLGIFSCKKLRISGISSIIDKITFVLRGVPFYVQLLIAYFVLPDILGINLSPFMAGIISLGFCSGAYICQIIRTGINSIPKGQWEASYVLGYGLFRTVKNIIVPQMVRNISPAICGELDQLLKSTSLLSAIGFLELTRVGMNIIAREMNPVSTYLIIAVLYLSMSSLLNITSKKIEKKMAYES